MHSRAATHPHRRRRRRQALGAGLLLIALPAALPLLLWLLSFAYPFPDAELLARPPSRAFFDRDGNLLRLELGWHDCWLLPVDLDAISPHLVAATLAAEDRRFWQHAGIDWLAVGRAVRANLAGRRVASGASTLSMQLARLAVPGEPPGWRRKFKQTARAIDLERRFAKEWILEQYLNHAPYGGNLVGAEAAARHYFGKPARDLTLPEATLLAGLPQRPATLRPDRHPAAARRRQRYVLNQLAKHRPDLKLDPHTLATLPLELATPDRRARLFPAREPHFCRLAGRQTSAATIHTALDSQLQTILRTALAAQADHLAGVADGAAVVIENQGGLVRGLVGTLDFAALPAGQVDAANARRSPGSALKPFLYLAALDRGLIVPNTRLDDHEMAMPNYRPGNFDGHFRGQVRAVDALTQSLNTPAIRLLRELGPEEFLATLRQCGLRTLDRDAGEYGLALALGGGEVTLLELANAYAGLARGGHFHAWSCLDEPPPTPASSHPFAPDAVWLLNDILANLPLPGAAGLPLAWKTGTSNGLRDAWCIAFNRDVTIAVWLGNKDGTAAANLVGASAAAPVVANLFLALYRATPPPPVQAAATGLQAIAVCARSGLATTISCTTTEPAWRPADVLLRQCRLCRPQAAAELAPSPTPPIHLLSPAATTYIATDGTLELPVRTTAAGPATWFLDGRLWRRETGDFHATFPLGTHTLTRAATPTQPALSVTFRIAEP